MNISKSKCLRVLILVASCVFTACAADRSDGTGTQKAETNKTQLTEITYEIPKEQYGPIAVTYDNYLFLNEALIYTKEDENGYGYILYCFDENSGSNIALCSKGNCAHEAADLTSGKEQECDAQIVMQSFLSFYNERLYYLSDNEKNGNLQIRSRDIMGTDDKTEAELDVQNYEMNAWTYGRYVFVSTYTDVSSSFDAETRQSDISTSILYVVDLEKNETHEVLQSEQVGTDGAFVLSGYDGEKINVYRTVDKQCFQYNLLSHETNAFDEMMSLLSDKCINEGNPDGNTYYISANDYMYGIDCVQKNVMQLDMKTGQETVIHQKEDDENGVYGIFTIGNFGVIINATRDADSLKNYYYLDTDSGEISKIENDFTDDANNLDLNCAGEIGIVYNCIINEDEQNDGDETIETRFIGIDNFLDGKNEYVSLR